MIPPSMHHATPPISHCRFCKHYNPAGRRGGHCESLGAMVRGNWQACPLAIPTFSPLWSELQEAIEHQLHPVSTPEIHPVSVTETAPDQVEVLAWGEMEVVLPLSI